MKKVSGTSIGFEWLKCSKSVGSFQRPALGFEKATVLSAPYNLWDAPLTLFKDEDNHCCIFQQSPKLDC